MTSCNTAWRALQVAVFLMGWMCACRSPDGAPVSHSAAIPAAPAVADTAAGEFTGQRVVEWTGRARDLKYTCRWASYYTADEFAFVFESPAHGRWQVISREPTPFETYRMGTTYTGLEVDWQADPTVRLVAVKGVDRMPETFPGLTLDPSNTLTVLILEVQSEGTWKPWYINNWFHRWSSDEENARIARHYVNRDRFYDVYGWRSDAPAELTAASRELVARFPGWRCYHGVLVQDASARNGFALELRHVFQGNPASGGNECVVGDPATLVPLTAVSPPAVAAAPAGWWMIGGGPTHRGLADPLPPPLTLCWEAKGAKAFAGGAAVAGGRVYIGNNDGKLYAFDAAKGKPLWTFATGIEVECTPAVWRGMVFFGGFDGKVYALDAATGAKCWDFQTGPRRAGFKGIEEVKQGVDSGVALVEGRAYFGGWDGKVYCLDGATGRPVWSFQTGGMIHWSAPAVAEGKVVIGSTDGVVQCLDADKGTLVWQAKLAEANADHMMSGPTIAEGAVYVGGGYENKLYALGLADGVVRWSYTAANLVCSSPAVDAKRVYGLADGAGHIFALDRADGHAVWSRHFGAGWGACNPVVCGRVLYVTMRDGSEDGKPVGLVALDTESGKTLWSFGPGPAWAGPAVADGHLFYGSDDGLVRCFGPQK